MNKFKAAALAAFILIMTFLLCGCTSKSDSSAYESKGTLTVTKEKSSDSFLYSSTEQRENLSRISRSDMTVLYLDESNFSICIYDTGSKKLWRALPESTSKNKPCMLTVKVLYKGQRYVLNSQDDSVAQKLASFMISENSVCINYAFKKSFDDGAKIEFTVPLVFSARDGMMSVELDCKKMNESNKGNTVIESISLLEWFGSCVNAEKNDYIFIPDGCGAVIKTSPTPKKFKKISLPVYEKDGAGIACFGVKSGASAFVAVVEQGDAISTVNAEKQLSTGGANRVYADFKITETQKKDSKIYVAGSSYNDSVKISYRFLSDDTANYVGMASACRELLIRNGVLDLQEQNNTEGALPLNLTLIGAAEFAKHGKDSRETTSVLTNPEQAYDMLSYIKSKGIDSINVQYKGIFNGALNQKENLHLAPAFSSSKKTNALIDFAQNQNIRIFASAELFTAKKSSVSSKAVGLDSKALTVKSQTFSSTLFSSVGEQAFQSADKLEKHSGKLLAAVRRLPFDGVSLSDAGSLLYSDNSKKGSCNRQQIKDIITNQVNAFSANKNLMISGDNIYALKYASVITNLANSSKANNKYISSIPFMQIILHGYTDYSSTAFNLEKDPENAFLKAVEYGCVPAYDLYFADFSTDDIQDNYSYENYLSQMQTYYERMNKAFSDLRDKKITAHSQIKSGVFRTEYGSSACVYVNYNNKDVTVNGITVEAKSFIRV